MKSFSKLLTVALLAMLITSCSTVKITTDYDKTVDFTQLKTFEYFGWADESDKLLNELERRRIEAAFAEEFKKRGIERVDTGGDMVVALYVMTVEKTQYNATSTGMGYGGYYGYGPRWGWGPGYGVGMTTTTVNEYKYTVGTLVVDVFDAQNEKLIWESIATGTVDDNPQTREKNIPKVVSKIMEPYPVKPAGE